ncbi:MAG: HNH endonuclease [Trichormus sp.]
MCKITSFDAEEALEAAHIIPYIETENNHPSNGLLLRADLHTLFDLNLIAIHPEKMMVHISPALQKTEYSVIQGKDLRLPKNEIYYPNLQFLKKRCEMCEWFRY